MVTRGNLCGMMRPYSFMAMKRAMQASPLRNYGVGVGVGVGVDEGAASTLAVSHSGVT
jgi:hypothetical protein